MNDNKIQKSNLYIVATPIGNLEDITFRAINTLKSCDIILCENIRNSSILLKKYEINTKLKPYNNFNEHKIVKSIIKDLINNNNIALISDKGTPCISDPGYLLINEALRNNINIISIPGACAAITLASVSGLPLTKFQFLGFLSKKKLKKREQIIEISKYNGATIIYESPYRIENTLNLIHSVMPNSKVIVGRELTKVFETIYRVEIKTIIKEIKDLNFKGEYSIIIKN